MPDFKVTRKAEPKKHTFVARKDLPSSDADPVREEGSLPEFTPTSDRALAETRKAVKDFEPSQPVDEIILPPDSTIPTDTPLAKFNTAAPESIDLQRVRARAQALDIASQWRSEGIELDDVEVDNISEQLIGLAQAGIEGAAKQRPYWNRISKAVGRKAGDVVATGVENAGLGLALLDITTWVNKKFKLAMMTPDQRALVENEVLPPVNLGGKDYFTGTHAAADIMRRRLWGWGERRAGDAVGLVSDELGEKLRSMGEKESRAAREQIPALVTGLGRPLPWYEVAQRSWSPDDPDNFYKNMNPVEMTAMALGDAVSELLVDPMLMVGGIFGKMPNITRAALTKIAPVAASKQASKIARTTVNLDDALNALDAAKAAEKKVNEQAQSAAERIYAETGQRVIPVEHVKRQILARQRVNNETMFVSNMQGAGEADPIILRRTPRQNPETVRATERIEYVDGVHVTGEGPVRPITAMKEELDGMKSKLAHLQVLRSSANNADDMAVLTRQIKDVEGQLNSIYEKGGRPEFTLVEPTIKVVKNARKSSTELAEELAEVERNELMRDYDVTPDITDEGSLLQQYQILGPDDSEQAGDALNLMVRTGGTGINSIKVSGTAIPEYRTFGTPSVPLVNWRKIDEAKQTLKAERALAGQTEYNVNSSAVRALTRHEDIVRRNLGEARRVGNKKLIDGYERDLKLVDKAKTAIKADPDYNLEKAFDKAWLPAETKSLMEDPGKFNQWLKLSGDRAVRGLYPGSLQLKTYEAWRASKLFAPLREPMRFFEAYAPGSWTRFRGATDHYDQSTGAFRDQIEQLGEEAGIIKYREKWDIKKDFHPYTVDEKADELLFNLLNTKKNSDEFNIYAHQATPEMMRLYTKIRAKLNYFAEQQGITDTEMMIEDYIRHVFTPDQFAQGMRPLEFIGLPIDPEVFASHLMRRTGNKGYPKSAMLALELYNRGAHRKLILEPAYRDIIQTGQEIAAKYNAPVLQTYANDLVEQLKGKPSVLAKHVESWLGGKWKANKIDQSLMGLTSMIWAGTLPLNPRYSVMQIGTGVITTASRFGLFRTAKAIMAMGTPEGQKIARAIGLDKSHHQFFESDVFRNVNEFLSKRGYALSPFGVMSTAQTEFFARGVTANAAVDMYLTKFGFASWEEAKDAGWASRIAFEALRSSEEVNHMFGAMGRSPWVSRRLTHGLTSSATQFLSFMPKQIEELAAQTTKDPGKLVQYLAFSGYFAQKAAEATGIDTTNYVGLGFLTLNPDQYSSPGVDMMIKYIEMNAAWSSLDPEKAEKATTEFIDTARIIAVPGGAGINALFKGAERISTGEQLTLDGTKLRNLDFAHIDFMHDPSLENFGKAMNPARSGDLRESTGMKGVGGDFLPSVFGQQSVRDALFTRGLAAERRENKRFARELRNVCQDLATAIEDGDFQKADELGAKFEDVTKVRIQSLEPVERAIFARHVSQLIRDAEQDPILLDRFNKIASDFGLDWEP